MAHARRFTGRRTPSLKTWLGQTSPAFGVDIPGPAGTFSPGLKVFGTPNNVDVTILRTRGEFSVAFDGALPLGELYQIALGVGLCTTEASLAGAVPLPFDNPEWDGWFVYMVMGFERSASSATTETQFATMAIDSKAMRKIPSGQVLFLSTQVFTASGAGGFQCEQSIQIRLLQKTS